MTFFWANCLWELGRTKTFTSRLSFYASQRINSDYLKADKRSIRKHNVDIISWSEWKRSWKGLEEMRLDGILWKTNSMANTISQAFWRSLNPCFITAGGSNAQHHLQTGSPQKRLLDHQRNVFKTITVILLALLASFMVLCALFHF